MILPKFSISDTEEATNMVYILYHMYTVSYKGLILLYLHVELGTNQHHHLQRINQIRFNVFYFLLCIVLRFLNVLLLQKHLTWYAGYANIQYGIIYNFPYIKF